MVEEINVVGGEMDRGRTFAAFSHEISSDLGCLSTLNLQVPSLIDTSNPVLKNSLPILYRKKTHVTAVTHHRWNRRYRSFEYVLVFHESISFFTSISPSISITITFQSTSTQYTQSHIHSTTSTPPPIPHPQSPIPNPALIPFYTPHYHMGNHHIIAA